MAPTFRPPGPIGSGGIGRGVAFDQAFSTTAGIETAGVPRGPQGRSEPPVAGREPVSPELRELALSGIDVGNRRSAPELAGPPRTPVPRTGDG